MACGLRFGFAPCGGITRFKFKGFSALAESQPAEPAPLRVVGFMVRVREVESSARKVRGSRRDSGTKKEGGTLRLRPPIHTGEHLEYPVQNHAKSWTSG
jgi:hypothetical protein